MKLLLYILAGVMGTALIAALLLCMVLSLLVYGPAAFFTILVVLVGGGLGATWHYEDKNSNTGLYKSK